MKTTIIFQDFIGEKDAFFCGVFDGHGPAGHRVAQHVRDQLPSKLSSVIQSLQNKGSYCKDPDLVVKDVDGRESGEKEKSEGARDSCEEDFSRDMLLSSWEASFVKSFKEIDDELSLDSSIDSFCSGTTAVTMVKQVRNRYTIAVMKEL